MSLNTTARQHNLKLLLDILESPPTLDQSFVFEGEALSEEFKNAIGLLVKAAEWQEPPADMDDAANRIFTRDKDKRGEVGHMLSHLDAVKRNNPQNENFGKLYKQFRKNAESVVLILAEPDDWDLPSFERKAEIIIPSRECRELVDFGVYGPEFEGIMLCPEEFYSSDHIPNADIFGSGCFVSPDRVATAAHVLEAAEELGTDPQKLIFIRRHYDYGNNLRVKVSTNQIYRLSRKQKKILEDSRAVYGQKGDSAWVEVEPYFKNTPEPYPEVHCDITTTPLQRGQRLYALGHGLAVPMKLSFDVEVGEIIGPYWFHSDMHVFPGNSGSPIFDANSQQLVGIVNGIHALNVKKTRTNCIKLDINLRGKLSILSSQITPLDQNLQNLRIFGI